jgi:hypothetical protein
LLQLDNFLKGQQVRIQVDHSFDDALLAFYILYTAAGAFGSCLAFDPPPKPFAHTVFGEKLGCLNVAALACNV